MRIIVTGGRDYDDALVVAYALSHYAPTGPHTLVHGACKTLREDRTLYTLKAGEKPGADRLAHFLALALGWEVEPYPALWSVHGKVAGPRRNEGMAARGADGLIAFPGGKGTANMVACARQAGIPVWEPARAKQAS